MVMLSKALGPSECDIHSLE